MPTNIFGRKAFAVTKYCNKLYHEWPRGVAHFVAFDCLLTVVTDLDLSLGTEQMTLLPFIRSLQV
jgi:hypothetical protein